MTLRELAREIAKLYLDPQRARMVIADIGVPLERMPVAATPELQWRAWLEEIADGAAGPAGDMFNLLISRILEDHPGNPRIRRVRDALDHELEALGPFDQVRVRALEYPVAPATGSLEGLIALLEARAARIRDALLAQRGSLEATRFLERFSDLHGRHVGALRRGDPVLTHELVGEIQRLIYEAGVDQAVVYLTQEDDAGADAGGSINGADSYRSTRSILPGPEAILEGMGAP